MVHNKAFGKLHQRGGVRTDRMQPRHHIGLEPIVRTVGRELRQTPVGSGLSAPLVSFATASKAADSAKRIRVADSATVELEADVGEPGPLRT